MIKKFDRKYNLTEFEEMDGAHPELSDCGIIEDVKNACIDRYGHKIRIRITTVKKNVHIHRHFREGYIKDEQQSKE